MELPTDGDVKHWRIPQVVNWLNQYQMAVYTQDFQNSYVDGEKLLSLTEIELLGMHVHPTHIRSMLQAIGRYQACNPDNDYEFADSEDADDFADEEDDEGCDSMTDNYTGADEIENIAPPPQANRPRVVRPPPPPEEDDAEMSEPEESYEVPDDMSQPAPPPRPQRNTAQLAAPPVNPPASHRKVPPTPQQNAPLPTGNPGRRRAVPAPPPENSGRMTSLPDTPAPVPPLQKGLRGTRPPAPLPTDQKPPPLAPHPKNYPDVITTPMVPLVESLESEETYEEVDRDVPPVPQQDQDDYDVVAESDPPITNNNTIGRSGRNGPLPKPPIVDGGSGGTFSPLASKYKGPAKLPQGRNQYPLVTLPPNSSSGSNRTPRKKLQSYDPHELTLSPPTPVPVRPAVTTSYNKPLPDKPLPNPPPNPPITNRPQFPPKNDANLPATPQKPQRSNNNPYNPGPTSTIDVTGMTIKERQKILQSQGDPGLSKVPLVTAPRPDMMQQMIDQQAKRWNTTAPVQPPARPTNGGKPVIQSNTSEPSKPLVVAAPRKHIAGRGNEPPPLPGTPHPSIKALPPTHIGNGSTGSQPLRRASIDSAASNTSAEEDRGLYSYTWYKSDMLRAQSMVILQRRRGVKGAFIVRKSTKEASKPYTLDVMYDDLDFHIPLRRRDDGHFAMGKSQANEDHWPSVPDLVEYFRGHSLALTRILNGETIKRSTYLVD